MSEVTYRDAVIQALGDELESDPRVVLIGEDVGAAGGVFKATEGLTSASAACGYATLPSPSRRSWAP